MKKARPKRTALVGAPPKRSGPKPAKYEQLKFVAPAGSRAFYREAAALAGLSLNAWIRATLHKEACRMHDKHRAEYDPPAVHPVPPPPLQPGTR